MPSSAVYFRLQKRKDTLVHGLVSGLPKHKGFKSFGISPENKIMNCHVIIAILLIDKHIRLPLFLYKLRPWQI